MDIGSLISGPLGAAISGIIGLVTGGALGSLITYSRMNARLGANATLADQRGATAGGDNVGRDKIT
ncbi:MAG TPA: hypothetical protein VEB20_02340, partial [Azospirillaceae bacterium]|nr:hypothetical protein [Azospirillaceae bacterium]